LLRFLVRTWISKEDGQRPVYDLWCRFLLVGPVCFALYLYTSDCTIALKECAFSTASRFEFRVSHCAACGSHLLVAFLTMPAILSGSSHQTCPLSSLKHFCRGVCVCVCVCALYVYVRASIIYVCIDTWRENARSSRVQICWRSTCSRKTCAIPTKGIS